MITNPSTDRLLKNAANRYELTVAISKRARQIVDGDKPKYQTKEISKVTIAAIEFEQEKYSIEK